MTNQQVIVTTTAPAKRRRMTREQAADCVRQINENIANTRQLLWDLYSRRGWKALGYSSWEACVISEFDQSRSYLHRILKAAKIERELSPRGDIGVIPEKHLRSLSALNPGHWKSTWDLANKTAPNGKLTTAHVEATVKQVMESLQPVDPPIPVKTEDSKPATPPAAISPTAPESTATATPTAVLIKDISPDAWADMLDPKLHYPGVRRTETFHLTPYPTRDAARIDYPLSAIGLQTMICTGEYLLKNQREFEDWKLEYPIAAPAAPEIPFAFNPAGVYLYDEDARQIFVNEFSSIARAKVESPNAKFFPEYGANLIKKWAERYSSYSLTTLEELAASEYEATRYHPGEDQAYCPTCKRYHGSWNGTLKDVWQCVFCNHTERDDSIDIKDFAKRPVRTNGNGYKPMAPASGNKPANSALFTSSSYEWYTPDHIVERARKVLSEIDLDPASSAEANKTVKAATYYDIERNGLLQEWKGKTYMNPPYGEAIGKWVEKLCDEFEAGHISEAVALLPARTDTQWMRRLAKHPRCFVWGRLNFSNSDNSATFPSIVIYLGSRVADFHAAFSDVGDIYTYMAG
jgi:hypothetical protein